MTLGHVRLLSSFRLRNIAASKETEMIDQFINMGIADLYNRFNLSVKSEHVQTTNLVSVYTLSNTDVLLLLMLYNSQYRLMRSSELMFSDWWEWKQLNYNSFTLNKPKNDDYVIAIYKGTSESVINDDDVIPLPDSFLDALLLYVNWHINATVSSNMATNGRGGMPEADYMYKQYENACNELELQGYKVNINTETIAIQAKGFR